MVRRLSKKIKREVLAEKTSFHRSKNNATIFSDNLGFDYDVWYSTQQRIYGFGDLGGMQDVRGEVQD